MFSLYNRQQENKFYKFNEDKFGFKFTFLYHCIKNSKRKVSFLEYRLQYFKLFVLNKITPKYLNVSNKNLHTLFPQIMETFQNYIFDQYIQYQRRLLASEKTQLFQYINCFFKNFEQETNIQMIRFINHYKSYCDFLNFKKLQKNIFYFYSLGFDTNIFSKKSTLKNNKNGVVTVKQKSSPASPPLFSHVVGGASMATCIPYQKNFQNSKTYSNLFYDQMSINFNQQKKENSQYSSIEPLPVYNQTLSNINSKNISQINYAGDNSSQNITLKYEKPTLNSISNNTIMPNQLHIVSPSPPILPSLLPLHKYFETTVAPNSENQSFGHIIKNQFEDKIDDKFAIIPKMNNPPTHPLPVVNVLPLPSSALYNKTQQLPKFEITLCKPNYSKPHKIMTNQLHIVSPSPPILPCLLPISKYFENIVAPNSENQSFGHIIKNQFEDKIDDKFAIIPKMNNPPTHPLPVVNVLPLPSSALQNKTQQLPKFEITLCKPNYSKQHKSVNLLPQNYHDIPICRRELNISHEIKNFNKLSETSHMFKKPNVISTPTTNNLNSLPLSSTFLSSIPSHPPTLSAINYKHTLTNNTPSSLSQYNKPTPSTNSHLILDLSFIKGCERSKETSFVSPLLPSPPPIFLSPFLTNQPNNHLVFFGEQQIKGCDLPINLSNTIDKPLCPPPPYSPPFQITNPKIEGYKLPSPVQSSSMVKHQNQSPIFNQNFNKQSFNILNPPKKFLTNKSIQNKNNNVFKPMDSGLKLEAFLNKTNINFDSLQMSLLNKGPKATFTPQPPPPPQKIKHQKLSHVIETDYILRNILFDNPNINHDMSSIYHKDIISQIDKQILNTYTPPVLNDYQKNQNQILNSIKIKLKQQNSLILLADKSSTLVAVTQDDYTKGMMEALEKNHFSLIKKDKSLTNSTKLKKLLFQLHDDNIIDQKTYKQLYPQTSAPCVIYGRHKSHKPQGGYRPLVDTSQSYFSSTSKWLHSFLKKYNHLVYNVKNSCDLLNKIRDIDIGLQTHLISLDVDSMYGSINLDLSIDTLIARYRVDRCKTVKLKISDLKYLLDLCTRDISCLFEGKLYTQTGGILMGHPLGGLVADIHISIIEKKVMAMKDIGKGSNATITSLHRYADDTLLYITHPSKAKNILDTFNSIDSTIKFTMEESINNTINFLDLTLSINNKTLEYKVFRKPSQNHIKINYDSSFPNKIKNNILKQEIIRAYRLSSNESHLSVELNFIRKLYYNNGYPLKLINNYIKFVGADFVSRFLRFPISKTKNSKPLPLLPSTLPNLNADKINNSRSENNYMYNYHCLNLDFYPVFKNPPPPPSSSSKLYLKIDDLHSYELINPVFQIIKDQFSDVFPNLKNINLVTASPPTLQQYFQNTHKKSCGNQNLLVGNGGPSSVVYRFVCVCAESYLGNTRRQVALRIREHIQFDINSKIYIHLKQNLHKADHTNFSILYKTSIYSKLQIAESVLIRAHHPTLNTSRGWALITNNFFFNVS